MFKHTVEYVDFNGNSRKEDLYFHLSTPEVTRIQAEIGKSLKEHIEELVANQDLNSLLKFLEMMLLNSYGQRSLDGKTFVKTKEVRESFEYSQAYAEIFEQVINNPELAKRFGEEVSNSGKQKRNQIDPKVVNTPQV